MDDLISRQAAIDALWKALFSYEEKEEERFQKSEELDVGDWFPHRIFVQNMNDIDRQVIRELPSAQPAQNEMIKEIRKWINSGNRGGADYFIVDKIEEIINKYER